MEQLASDGNLPPSMQVDATSTRKQFYEFLAQYNRVSENCFNNCIHDFTTRKVLESENNCAVTCLEKFMKAMNRISLRFQEIQLTRNEVASALAAEASHK